MAYGKLPGIGWALIACLSLLNAEAKGADVVVHEAFFTPEQWMRIAGFPYKQAYWVTTVIHTPPEGFGKIMSTVKPRLAVAYHYWNHRDLEFEIYEGIRETYSGPLAMANDEKASALDALRVDRAGIGAG